MIAPTIAPTIARTIAPRRQTTAKVVRYEVSNLLRSRWLLAYAAFFFIVTDTLVRFGDGGKALLSLVNIVLLVVPLVGLVFGTTYVHDARDFTELLLAQPIGRRELFIGLYIGLALPLSVASAAGIGLAFALHGVPEGSLSGLLWVIGICTSLTMVFVALAFLIATRADDKVKGLGVAIGVWLATALLYDGAVLLVVALFSDYPIERPMIGLMLANPIDLARVLLLLRFDVAALMGYTGAVFSSAFGGAGVLTGVAALGAWVLVPLLVGMRVFRRKDF